MNSEKFTTSFDINLTPGTYYLETDGYGFDGIIKTIVDDNCTNSITRPFMFDAQNKDAFGRSKPVPPAKLDLFTCGCNLASNSLDHVYKDVWKIVNNEQLDSTKILYDFNDIDITFTNARLLKQIKLTVNKLTEPFFYNNKVQLRGRNSLNDEWVVITNLYRYFPVEGFSNNILLDQLIDNAIPYKYYNFHIISNTGHSAWTAYYMELFV